MVGKTPEITEPSGETESEQPPQPVTDEPQGPRHIEVKGGRGVVIGNFARVVINGIDESLFRRFGLDVRLGFVLLALLVISASSVIIYLLVPKQGNMKTDLGCELCVAVASFAEGANPSEKGIGLEFGATLSSRLGDNLADLPTDMTIEVWGPAQVGSPSGSTIPELDQSARKLAQQIGADILVYGLITTTQATVEVSPRFYISPDYAFRDALDVIGQDQLGDPFQVAGEPKGARDKRMYDRASSRGKMLSDLVLGMTYFVTSDYDNALVIFQEAELTFKEAESNAQDQEDPATLRFLYLMMGNSKLRQYERDPKKPELLKGADTYYWLALASNPGYARPYIGLGSIAYLQALLPALTSSNPAATDLDLLKKSMNYYRQASALAPEPDLAHVKEKAHMWLGQDYLAGSYAELYKTGKSPNFQSAMDEFRQVILAYDRAPDEILAELAADAHARLGLIARLENHLQEGIDEYQKALDLVSDPVKKEQYQEALATLQATGP